MSTALSLHPISASSHARRRAGVAALAVWFAATTAVSASLLVRHTLPFVAPSDGDSLHALWAANAPPTAAQRLAVHALSSTCLCSRRIAAHLAARAPLQGWREVVLWTGNAPPPDALRRAGYDVRAVTREALTAWGVRAVPVLVAFDAVGATTYVGGYTDRKQGPDPRDVDVLTAAARGRHPTPLPLYGCSTAAATSSPRDRVRAFFAGW